MSRASLFPASAQSIAPNAIEATGSNSGATKSNDTAWTVRRFRHEVTAYVRWRFNRLMAPFRPLRLPDHHRDRRRQKRKRQPHRSANPDEAGRMNGFPRGSCARRQCARDDTGDHLRRRFFNAIAPNENPGLSPGVLHYNLDLPLRSAAAIRLRTCKPSPRARCADGRGRYTGSAASPAERRRCHRRDRRPSCSRTACRDIRRG